MEVDTMIGFKDKSILFLLVILCMSVMPIMGCDPPDPDPTMRTLTMQVEGQGATSPLAGAHQFEEGAIVNLTATPAEGWVFDRWVGAVADPTLANTSVIMYEDQTVKAVFKEKEVTTDYYSLDVNIIGEGSVEQDPLPKHEGYEEGTIVTLTATPAEGWVFDGWMGDVEDLWDAKTTIQMNEDKTIIAFFKEKEDQVVEYTLTIEIEGQGTVDPPVGTHQLEEGSTVHLTATPAEGWGFHSWEGDVSNPSSPTTTITMDSHKTVKALFSSADTVTRLRDLGPEGDLQDPNNVFVIIDNTNLGYWSVSLLQSRLPLEFANADTYTLTILNEVFTFSVNPFNNDMFEVNVRDLFTIEEVRDGLFSFVDSL